MDENKSGDTTSGNVTRREFLKRTSRFSIAALGGAGFIAHAAGNPDGATGSAIARGTVFLDANRSGRADGQRGLPGVLVSNGVDLVETDEAGEYSLPVTEDTIIHVIKPRGYRTTIDDLNLPRFYYIHKPEGSPDDDFLYKGIAPTGPLPARIDFPLYEQEEPDAFEVLFTADPQAYNLQHLKWYAEETTAEFSRQKVAFGIALGDIVGNHLDLLEPYNRVNAHCGFPWHNVIGNHDLNFMASGDRYSDETFKRIFGPTTYAFQYGRVHFIILNNVFWRGFTRMRRDGWPRRGQYRGHIRPAQFEYIRNYLQHTSTDERIVVCAHIPMVERPGVDEKHGTPEFPELLQLLSKHPYTLSFSGHHHINMNHFYGEETGYRAPGGALHHHCNLTAASGSWYRGPLDRYGVPFSPGRDGSPKGYALVRFEGGDRYRISLKALGCSADEQMSVTLPAEVERAKLAGTTVQVNVFSGSEKTRVSMRVDEGPWIELEQNSTVDRQYSALRQRSEEHPDAGEGRLRRAITTDHIWEAPLPAEIADGWHDVTVVCKGTFGERWTAKRTFLVVSDPAALAPLRQGTRSPREV